MSSSSRPFSTASPVHPNYLPKLHKSGRMEKKLAAATIAAMGVGYTVSALRNSNSAHFSTNDTSPSSSSSRQRQHTYSSSSSSGGYLQQKQRELAMLDAYGGGESLEELEAAVNAYAAQQAQQSQSRR